MSAFAHSRNSSQESASSGASYQDFLDDVLSYPGTYEIPLRTMYTLNCVPRAQPQHSRANSPTGTPTSATFDQQLATAQFTSALVSQISRLKQPSSLPPSFVTSFLNKCFAGELHLVDFPQALTGLDYLKDLEKRRQKEVDDTLRRLGLDRDARDSELEGRDQTVAEWVRSLEDKERKVEEHYAHLYIGLRRWILINEMSLTPFNRHNCIAMLNTLYPPGITSLDSRSRPAQITDEQLARQHAAFFNCIKKVEKSGTSCLERMMNQGRASGDVNGWASIRHHLSAYLTLANNIINECHEINLVNYEPKPVRRAKVDSGIFDSKHCKRPSTGSNTSASSYEPHSPSQKTPSRLGRIAREFRRMRPKAKSDADVSRTPPAEEPTPVVSRATTPTSSPKRAGMLRKMKSLGALGDLRHGNGSVSSFHTSAAEPFNPDTMRRHRAQVEQRMAV
ncbi:hypothetical protein EJ06DRAFT_341028 [Trichodelitschia bisporula]|uniref:Uncharacterized protein n=1 Tax=Trichodelitschia bisporula TaxID=703511 RepID=A0A6G1I345_9PEZI|nr:hypothetical protein EJ06DRAFT_341028 [Trichodelitschia bisporula]